MFLYYNSPISNGESLLWSWWPGHQTVAAACAAFPSFHGLLSAGSTLILFTVRMPKWVIRLACSYHLPTTTEKQDSRTGGQFSSS